ncbi:MAG TPA: nucleotide-binding protein [Methanoculleus sp.]|nr:nucleotide-binding protein [Methanoculleus sp.]
MRMHYALVDDLLSPEEFERRVAETIAKAGDLIDEHTAAVMVVREAGRQHVKIRDVPARATLTCFFGKILGIEGPKHFERRGGDCGQVSSLMVGDDSGEIRAVLWDDAATAVTELEVGEVLEIFGRPKQSGAAEVHVLDMRRTPCDIATREEGARVRASGEVAAETLEVRVVHIEKPRRFVRRDGTEGELVEAVVGNEEGTARLVCWYPPLLDGVIPKSSLHIEGARPNPRARQREYTVGELAAIRPAERDVTVPFSALAEVEEGSICAVCGQVAAIDPPRRFTTRKGEESWVRNGVLADESGTLRVVFWGDLAKEDLVPREGVELYHAVGRRGRDGEMELHAGWGSALVIALPEPEEISVRGTVIDTAFGRCIDDGRTSYLLDGDLMLGAEVKIRGTLTGRRLRPITWEPVMPDAASLKGRAMHLIRPSLP